ncbi:MAG: hypothetical protein ACI9CF_001902 [Candidatus Omnitrophota bacterium]|jgi:hypothetical protein
MFWQNLNSTRHCEPRSRRDNPPEESFAVGSSRHMLRMAQDYGCCGGLYLRIELGGYVEKKWCCSIKFYLYFIIEKITRRA